MAKKTQISPDEILRWPAVRTKVGISRSSAYRMELEGRFPKRIKITEFSVGWLASEIDRFIQTRPRGVASSNAR